MTRHTRYAVTYGAVVALASALVAPSAAFAAPDATGGEVTPAAQQRPQAATQQANNTDTDQQTVTADDGASVSGVKVVQVGQEIVVSGSGWKDKNGGGSVAAVKLDGGAVVPRGQVSYGGKEYGSRGVVAVVEADDAGNFVARIPFPSADNSNVKDSDWGVGSKHTVTFLSGSLKVDGGGKKVDVVRSAELEVTVGDTKAEPQQTPEGR